MFLFPFYIELSQVFRRICVGMSEAVQINMLMQCQHLDDCSCLDSDVTHAYDDGKVFSSHKVSIFREEWLFVLY